MLRCFKLHPNVQDAELCNDLDEVEVQKVVEVEPDDDVGQGGKECAAGTGPFVFRLSRPRGDAVRGSCQGIQP